MTIQPFQRQIDRLPTNPQLLLPRYVFYMKYDQLGNAIMGSLAVNKLETCTLVHTGDYLGVYPILQDGA